MAKRRMFSLDIVDTDIFLDMPPTTQNLYFHLGMRADDDGFVAAPKKIMRACGGTPDDMKILSAKNYIIPFDDGVIVIRDWLKQNKIQPSRYVATDYTDHLDLLDVENGQYKLAGQSPTKCRQNVDKMSNNRQPSIGKDSIGEYSTDKDSVATNDNITKDDNNYMFTTTSVSTGRKEDDYDYHYFNAPEYDDPPFK